MLFKSHAISQYIATKWASSGTPFLPNPSNVKAVAGFKQATSIETSNFDPGLLRIVTEKVYKP